MADDGSHPVPVMLDPRRWPRWVKWGVTGVLLAATAFAAWWSFRETQAPDERALGNLRALTTAQEQFRQTCIVDQDQDGYGEYGYLAEMAGTAPCRQSGVSTNVSPFIAPILGKKDTRGRSRRHGHYFRIALPTGGGGWRWEPAQIPKLSPAEDIDAQEQRWIAYAWPADRAAFSRAVYAAGWTGEVFRCECDSKDYEGTNGPAPDAALRRDGTLPGWREGAKSHTGRDGNTWRPAGAPR